MDLVKEGRIIQERIRSSCQRVSKDYAKIFANLMTQGRVSLALEILTSDPCVGVHKINDDVINALKQKHPSFLTKGTGGPSQLQTRAKYLEQNGVI